MRNRLFQELGQAKFNVIYSGLFSDYNKETNKNIQ
ncbi:hypothetical protein EZS27_014340 [termite gut metagenome]|uniref:Uncharacterized protein n=1 Tax=termite gut metagenome TaxID=433724 RepID=A0A5J4RWE4_9ZZZZ